MEENIWITYPTLPNHMSGCKGQKGLALLEIILQRRSNVSVI
jgi:hypothetical protein